MRRRVWRFIAGTLGAWAIVTVLGAIAGFSQVGMTTDQMLVLASALVVAVASIAAAAYSIGEE
jgi:uncharacterized membrane protein YdcZ (DUF606 family)